MSDIFISALTGGFVGTCIGFSLILLVVKRGLRKQDEERAIAYDPTQGGKFKNVAHIGDELHIMNRRYKIDHMQTDPNGMVAFKLKLVEDTQSVFNPEVEALDQ